MAEPIISTLGIVGIKNCGAYDNSTNYEKLNVVTYEGSSYCAKGNTVGNLPTNTTYWDLLAEKGGTGDTGPTGPQGPKPVKGVDYYTAEDIAALESTLASDVSDEVAEQLGGLTSATPLAASDVSDMTDTTKIYVLTTDGHWYYHNGTAWTDGGVYQATEIDDNSVTLNKLNSILKSNVVENYGDIVNLFATPTQSGAYCSDNSGSIRVNSNESFNYIKIALDTNSNYFFYGYVSSIIDTLMVADENDYIVQKIERPSTSGYYSVYINTGKENRYLYFSYANGTSSDYRKRNTLTNLIKIDKTMIVRTKELTKYKTISDYILQDSLITVDSVIALNPIADPTTYAIRIDNYKIKSGIKYHIESKNSSDIGMLGIVITDDNNIVKYKSDISSTEAVYEFTPNYNGIAYLQYRVGYTDVPTIKIIDDYQELKDYVESLPIKNLSNKKWGLLGDSITESNFRTSKNYWGYIQDLSNIQINNVAVSGAGYKIYSPYNTYNQANNLANDVDFVTIFAGINDIAWTSTPNIGNITDTVSDESILGYVNGTIDRVLNKLNYSKPIGIISPLPSCIQDVFEQPDYQNNLYPSGGPNNMDTFVEKLKELCEYRGIPFLDLYHNSGLQPQNNTCRTNLFKAGEHYAADGLHPNADGHKFIYPRIFEFINKLI